MHYAGAAPKEIGNHILWGVQQKPYQVTRGLINTMEWTRLWGVEQNANITSDRIFKHRDILSLLVCLYHLHQLKLDQSRSTQPNWTHVNPREPNWTRVRLREPKWTQVHLSEPKCTQGNPSKPKWTQEQPRCTQVHTNASKLSKVHPSAPKLT